MSKRVSSVKVADLENIFDALEGKGCALQKPNCNVQCSFQDLSNGFILLTIGHVHKSHLCTNGCQPFSLVLNILIFKY